MEEQGLAQQATVQQPQVDPKMVQQVAQMLMQGMNPEELLAQGVPQEVLMMAMELVKQEMASEAMPAGQEGLAGMQAQGMV